jgi:hypothetical protein
MKHVITDNRIDKKCERGLRERGFELIKMPAFSIFQTPVAAHPDMLLFIGSEKIICHADYFAIAKKELSLIAEITGAELVLTSDPISSDYPRDVIFNAASVGMWLVCRRDAVLSNVAELYPENMIINVKQGYAKCSTAVVGDNAIITANPSIAKAVKEKGIDVLSVSPLGVRLDGYDCGFIGGASGTDEENVYFCGNIDLHPDSERIKAFCRKHGKNAVSLSDEPLYDYGTLIFVK